MPVASVKNHWLAHALLECRDQILTQPATVIRNDLITGLLVALVSIPFALALAIAAGVPPSHGLYTVIAAGGVVAALGGSRFQITGPTAAFAVILAPIVQKIGIQGLFAAGFLAGLLILAAGLAGLGSWVARIPATVSVGFSTGIAVVIARIELGVLSGLGPADWGIAALTLLLLVGMPRVFPRFSKWVPPAFLSLVAGSFAAAGLEVGFSVRMLGGIPAGLPAFRGIPELLPETLLPALSIALLGMLESLLSARVSDLDTGLTHDPRSELVALGIGNLLAPLWGGIPAAGAIARTTANWRLGARTPLSGIFHALWTALIVSSLAPLAGRVPLAALAAILLWVAWRMADPGRLVGLFKASAPRGRAGLLVTLVFTIALNMIVGVAAGLLVERLPLYRAQRP